LALRHPARPAAIVDELRAQLARGATGRLTRRADRGPAIEVFLMAGQILAAVGPEDGVWTVRRLVNGGALTERQGVALTRALERGAAFEELLVGHVPPRVLDAALSARFRQNLLQFISGEPPLDFEPMDALFVPNLRTGHDSAALLDEAVTRLQRISPLLHRRAPLTLRPGPTMPATQAEARLLDACDPASSLQRLLTFSPYEPGLTLDAVAAMLRQGTLVSDEGLRLPEAPRSGVSRTVPGPGSRPDSRFAVEDLFSVEPPAPGAPPADPVPEVWLAALAPVDGAAAADSFGEVPEPVLRRWRGEEAVLVHLPVSPSAGFSAPVAAPPLGAPVGPLLGPLPTPPPVDGPLPVLAPPPPVAPPPVTLSWAESPVRPPPFATADPRSASLDAAAGADEDGLGAEIIVFEEEDDDLVDAAPALPAEPSLVPSDSDNGAALVEAAHHYLAAQHARPIDPADLTDPSLSRPEPSLPSEISLQDGPVARPPGFDFDFDVEASELAFFADHDDLRGGGGGQFTLGRHLLDHVELRDELPPDPPTAAPSPAAPPAPPVAVVDEDEVVEALEALEADDADEPDSGAVALSFGPRPLSPDEALGRVAVAQEVLVCYAAHLDRGAGPGAGQLGVQLLLDGAPHAFGPLLHDSRVDAQGGFSGRALVDRLMRRPEAERRLLLDRCLMDLIERTLSAACEELPESALDALLEEIAGYQQRLR